MLERLVAALESIAESLADIAGGGIAMSGDNNATLPEPSEPVYEEAEEAIEEEIVEEVVEESFPKFTGVNKEQIVAITRTIAALGDEAIEDVKSALADQGVDKAGKLTTKKKRDGYVNHLSSLGHSGIIETTLEPVEGEEEEDESLI